MLHVQRREITMAVQEVCVRWCIVEEQENSFSRFTSSTSSQWLHHNTTLSTSRSSYTYNSGSISANTSVYPALKVLMGIKKFQNTLFKFNGINTKNTWHLTHRKIAGTLRHKYSSVCKSENVIPVTKLNIPLPRLASSLRASSHLSEHDNHNTYYPPSVTSAKACVYRVQLWARKRSVNNFVTSQPKLACSSAHRICLK